MQLQYKGVEIPEKFIEIAISKGLKSVGNYNGRDHKFFTPLLNPNTAELDEIKASFEEYGLFPERDEFGSVYKLIRNNLQDKPNIHDVNTLSESDLDAYDHVVFTEEDGSVTDTVYVGDCNFFVLTSTKSSLESQDRIRCISMPISVGDKEKFTIFRGGQEFIPIKATYPPTFRTNPLSSIKILKPPFLYTIIDGDERFGGRKIADANGHLLLNWLSFYSKVFNSLINYRSSHNNASLPDKEVFPDYDKMLAKAKETGVSAYLLDHIIELLESGRYRHEYCYNPDEWEADPRQKKLDYEENQQKAVRIFNEKSAELDGLLRKLRQRRVMLFFKAAAKVSPTTHKAIENIIKEMDAIAEDAVKNGYSGVGTKGTAQAKYDQAKAATKPERFENLKTGGILAAVVALAVFAGLSWYYSVKNKEVYDASEAAVMSRLDNSTDFDSIKSQLDSVYFAFKPAYARLVVRGSYVKNQRRIADAREAHIEKMVANINTMLKANRGRFNKYSEQALFKLLEVAPDDARVINLKDEWMSN